MRIIILEANTDKIVLKVRFTKEEIKHKKFSKALAKLDALQRVTVVTIDPQRLRVRRNIGAKEDWQRELGKLVDKIRELFSGGVEYTYTQKLKDASGNPLPDPKDFTDIPQFKVGETDTVIVEQPTGEVDEEGNPIMKEVVVEEDE